MSYKSNKFTIILYSIIIITIISLLEFGYKQNRKYKMCVDLNDQLSLMELKSAIQSIIVYHNKNELTQQKYDEFKNRIEIINKYIWRSDNLKFMEFEVRELIDIEHKDDFVSKKMDCCIKINNKIETIFKNEHDAMLLYKYFKDKENRKEFINLFAGI